MEAQADAKRLAFVVALVVLFVTDVSGYGAGDYRLAPGGGGLDCIRFKIAPSLTPAISSRCRTVAACAVR